jgi:hypothetical protein
VELRVRLLASTFGLRGAPCSDAVKLAAAPGALV